MTIIMIMIIMIIMMMMMHDDCDAAPSLGHEVRAAFSGKMNAELSSVR
jgi:hypothetical protein